MLGNAGAQGSLIPLLTSHLLSSRSTSAISAIGWGASLTFT